MDDLISRQDAINAIDLLYFDTVDDHDRTKERIKRLPAAQPLKRCIATIEFDEEKLKECVNKAIVRCKDCIYWLPHHQFGFDEDNDEYHDYCERLIPDDEYYAFYRNADDFCSRAERRTDETD